MSSNRRAILAGLAGLPFAAAPAVATSVVTGFVPADPFITYNGRIRDLHAEINAGPGEAAVGRLMEAWDAIDLEVMASCPTTFAGAIGALEYARREFVQFEMDATEETDDPSHRLVLHLLAGAIGVLRQAVEGGARV